MTWATEPVWAWTTVEAHLAIVCASAPALKVFFKQYLSVSSITGSWKDSSLRRSYVRKGYKEKSDLVTYGTSSTASKTMDNSDVAIATADVELGFIEVVHEVNVDTESMPAEYYDDARYFEDAYNDSKGTLRSSARQQGRKEIPLLKRETSTRQLQQEWKN